MLVWGDKTKSSNFWQMLLVFFSARPIGPIASEPNEARCEAWLGKSCGQATHHSKFRVFNVIRHPFLEEKYGKVTKETIQGMFVVGLLNNLASLAQRSFCYVLLLCSTLGSKPDASDLPFFSHSGLAMFDTCITFLKPAVSAIQYYVWF